ncbi:accessory Sec system glycosyltransferase GtfA [Lachnospiraceae bacterium]|jgi:poly(glycerol-phosphate) alpha-glucosyltransferase|nr:accessory Sec system glycosyltransferase GtfA [uncultured Schaedlerella sp.]NBI60101.1 accessory Sec system glycosyltransferase GtfA [Lachnospiraceae bacterium]
MIYNFNQGIGWASSGVEYAQVYRAKILRRIGKEAKFIFTNMFPEENIEHLTENIGFLDSEIIWLYTFFTDCKISPVTYTLEQLEQTFEHKKYHASREKNVVTYMFPGINCYYKAYTVNDAEDRVHRVEMISNGCLIRKDYYTYCRSYSEYYAPLDHKGHLYLRRFFNEDGGTAYEEIIDGDAVMYQFPDRCLYSKGELIGYMLSCLNLTKRDVVIIDRSIESGRAVVQNAAPARLGVVIHADHFNERNTDEHHVRWNNYYEYMFSQNKRVKFYVTSTDVQNRLLKKQFKEYKGVSPRIVTIPVGSLEELKIPARARRRHSLVTASRLSGEKHADWLIKAVAAARERIPDVSLDIYGKGPEEARLKELIRKLNCGDYVRLCGQKKMDEVYKEYEAYLSGSTSEGFGLSLMEAAGSGLPIIGFDVRYGNPNFIDEGKNGYLISVRDEMKEEERIQRLTECVIRLFTKADMEKFHQHSYEKARPYLTEQVEKKWQEVLK